MDESAAIAAIKLLAAPLPIVVSVALILFGTFAAQVYSYWLAFPRDLSGLKAFVLGLLFLECVHSALCIHIMYYYFIDQIGTPAGILQIVWSVAATIVLEILIIVLAQGFFIFRLWNFSGKQILIVAAPVFLVIARFGLAVANIFELATIPTWQQFNTTTTSRVLLDVGLSIGTVTDVMITGLMTYYLHQHKGTFRRTKHIVESLIFYTINTGLLTTVCSLAIVLFYNLVPNSLIFGGLIQLISKLYANSVLAMLNARQHLKDKDMGDSYVNTIPLQLRHTGIGNASQIASHHSRMGEMSGVRIDVYKHMHTDPDTNTRMSDTPVDHLIEDTPEKSDYSAA